MLQSDRRTRRPQRPLTRKPRRPRLELLEERQLLTGYTVTSALDNGLGTLRDAITQSNSSPGPNTITFDIGTLGTEQTIALQTALPAITTPVTINALSQGGAEYTGSPLIVLNGSAANGDGFDINVSNTTIEGFAIDKFSNGISVSGLGGPSVSNTQIEANYIGLDSSGVATAPNAFDGISVWNSTGATISGNVIAANSQAQLLLTNSNDNLIQGNRIGTNAAGTVGLDLGWDSIHLQSSSGNTIGGTGVNQGNLLAGGGFFDVLQLDAFPGSGGSANNLIEGNELGTNLAGNTAEDTTSLDVTGILIQDAGSSGNTIGGTAQGAGNLIAGMTSVGVQINSPGNLFEGNSIGTSLQGNAAIPNNGDGVVVNAADTTIGGTVAGAGNVISGNAGNGITVTSNATSGILIAGNFIGIDAGGTNAIPNGTSPTQVGNGIEVEVGGVTIGGSVAAAANVISGNAGAGIDYTSGASLFVYGNDIGTSAPAFNTGVLSALQPSGGNAVGILIDGGAGATIGGPGVGNVISGNVAKDNYDGSGIVVASSAGDNLIAGNMIGTDNTGTVAIPNGGNGITIGGSSTGDTIGGTNIGYGNVISGNANNGIAEQESATGLTIQGNEIGTSIPDITGAVTALGNGFNGVLLETSNNLVGGTVIGAGNIIAYNGNAQGTLGDGVWVNNVNAAPVGNAIQENSIYSNAVLGISLSSTGTIPTPIAPPANVGSPYANNHINYPTITQAVLNNGTTTVSGLLTDERPNTTYNIEFFESPQGDALGYGQGQTLIGEQNGVQTDSNGSYQFLSVFNNPNVLAGDVITATVTDASAQDGTSEFSKHVAIQTVVDLSINVTASPNPVYVNQQEVYTVTVTNGGTTDAHNVQIVDTLPNNLGQVVSAVDLTNPNSQGVNISGNTVTDTIALLPAGQTETLTITVVPSELNVSSMTDSALVTTSDQNTNGQTEGAATVTVKPVVPVALTVTANPVPAQVGQTLTYTVTLQNLNPTTPATGVVFTDTLDSNLVFNAATSTVGLTLAGTTLTDNVGTISAGGTVTLVINTTPLPSVVNPATDTGSVTNSASETYNEVASNQFALPSAAPLSAVTITTVNPVANVTVSFAPAPTPNPAPVDQPLTYTLLVSNNGPSTASNIVVTDVLDPNATFVPGASTPEWSASGQTLTDTIAQLAPGNSTTLVVVATPNAAAVSPLTDTGSVTNTASVTATEMATPSSATANVVVSPVAVLTVAGSATPNPVSAGANLVYTFTVTNTGPSTANDILFTDPIPLNESFVSANDSQGLTPGSINNTVTANLGTLTPGANAIVTITLQPTGMAGNVGSVTNTASVTADESPAGPSPSATVVTNVTPSADVSVAIQEYSNPDLIDTPMTYVITAANAGPSNATAVVVTDTLDPTVIAGTITPSQGTFSQSGQTITADLGTIAAGATATVTIVVTPQAAGTVNNSVNVSNTGEQDLNSTNNQASVSTQITPAADLAIQLTGSPNPVLSGSDVLYTATATNNGPSPATGVTINDAIPLGATFVSALTSAGGSYSITGSVITAYFPTLAVSAQASLTIDVVPSTRGTITDTASVSANELDPTPNNNAMSVSTTVLDLPGTFDFLNPTYTVNNNGGYATITVVRTNGVQGDVKIPYTTTTGSAQAGLDYTPVSGTLDFPDGVTTATFTVPVLSYAYDRADVAVGLALESPNGGAVLGSQPSAQLLIHVVNPDLTPPTVTGVTWNGVGSRGSSVTIDFSKPMNAATVTNVNNYQLVNTGTSSIYGARGNVHVAIASAAYNAATNSVVLVTAIPLRANVFYHLEVNGSTGAPITDIVGNVLAGNGSTAGTDDALYFGTGQKLSYADAAGNEVSLRLTGGGFLDLTRFPDGEADNLQIVNEVPHRTTLVGTISRGGSTVINSITGLGSFGDVRVRLTTPPFYVTVPSYASATPAVATPAVATAHPAAASAHALHKNRGGAFPKKHR